LCPHIGKAKSLIHSITPNGKYKVV
jgi:hypothetical protein